MNRTLLISLSCLAALLPAIAQAQNAAPAAPAAPSAPPAAASDSAVVAIPAPSDLGRDSFKALFQNNIFNGSRIKYVPPRTNPPPVLRETLTFNGGGAVVGKDRTELFTEPGRGRMDSSGGEHGIGDTITGTGLKIVSGDIDNVELQAADGTSYKLAAGESLTRENNGPWHVSASYSAVSEDDVGGGRGGLTRGFGGGGRGGRNRGGGFNNGGGGYNNGGYNNGFNNGGYNNGGYNNGGFNNGGYNNGGYNNGGYNGGFNNNGFGGGGAYNGYNNSTTSSDSGGASASSDSGSDSSTASSSSSSSSSDDTDSVIARLKAQREQN